MSRKEKICCHEMGSVNNNNERKTSQRDFSVFYMVSNRLHFLLEADCEFHTMRAAPGYEMLIPMGGENGHTSQTGFGILQQS